MELIAIDPGTEESAYVVYNTRDQTIEAKAILPNPEMVDFLQWTVNLPDHLAIEMVACYGMPVGKETFETCLWTGRFIQAARSKYFRKIYRMQVKSFLCHNARAKDANIRQALIDKLGQVGTKKNPGPLYGIKTHIWAALSVAVTAAETKSTWTSKLTHTTT
jgi:hypothetical protein